MTNDFEDQLDKIRVRLNENSKDLSREDFVKQMNTRARKIAKQYGMSIIASADEANFGTNHPRRQAQ
jgi:DICT domain-containing protein